MSVLENALELDHVESHLHPEPSYELSDHPEPTGREEVWRFTPLKRMSALLAGTPSDAALTWTTDLPAGVTIREISTAEAAELGEHKPLDRLAALAIQNSGKATLVDVEANRELDRPLVINLSGTDIDALVWGHIVVRFGDNSRGTVVFEHSGSAHYAAALSVILNPGSNVDYIALQNWEGDAVHVQQTGFRVGKDATLRSFEFTLGGDLVRLSTNVDYRGEAGRAELYGVYFADEGQHFEHRQFVDHNAPKTQSHVHYKGALQGQDAHTVWVGNVLIRKVAEGIETFEQNDNLVLTQGAKADSVPNLEIETGEIQGAGHASTTGRFDEQHLFYLQSRGIPEDEARALVVRGFFFDIIRRINVEEIAERLRSAIEKELEMTLGTVDE